MRPEEQRLKRAFDVGCAASALAVLSPLFLLVTALIKLDSRGPVFYLARRAGRNRKPFMFYKFRTMVFDADRIGSPMLTTQADRRVTRVGKYLRLFKIDELPQLFNVLKGDMSVVGPRPEVYEVVDRYYVEDWDRVLRLRPGLTCLLQTEIFPDCTYAHERLVDPFLYYIEHDLRHKLNRDLEYVERASLWLDLKIITKTMYYILFKSWSFLQKAKAFGVIEAGEKGP